MSNTKMVDDLLEQLIYFDFNTESGIDKAKAAIRRSLLKAQISGKNNKSELRDALAQLRGCISDYNGHGNPGCPDRAKAIIAIRQADKVLNLLPNALLQGRFLERSAEGRSGKNCPRSKATEPASNCYIPSARS